MEYLVKDTEKAIAFYTQRLGFSLVNNFGPFAIVSKADLTLWLADPKTSAAQPMPDGLTPEPGGWNRLMIEVDDIASMVAELKKEGTTFRNEIFTGVGGQQVLIEYPSGNPIELNQPAENRP